MKPSIRLLEPGIMRRSVDEFARLTSYAIRFQGLSIPKAPFPLITFSLRSSLDLCKTMADSDMGGYSSSNLEFVPASDSSPAHTRFFGSVSTDLPPDRPNLKGAGWVGFRTKDRKRTLLGSGHWDVDQYQYLAMRLKSDGRKYFVNLQTDSIEPTDLHQHRLYARRPGEWETVLIDINEFVRTNHGRLAEPQSEILKQKLNSVGFSLTDRERGPFELRVQKIWATNGLALEEEGRKGKSVLFDDEEEAPQRLGNYKESS